MVRDSIFADRSARSFDRITDYFRPQTIAGYIGWVGNHNFGDDLLYHAFKKLFPKLRLLLYGNVECRGYHKWSYPPPIELALYQNLVKKRLYDGVLLGGGTLINDPWYLRVVREALKEKRPFIVFGTGVREETYISNKFTDLDARAAMSSWTELLTHAAAVKVRGPYTAERLREVGIQNVQIIGDPALYALDYGAPPIHERTIAISLGGIDSVVYGNQERISETGASLAKELIARGWKVEFLPMMDEDLHLIENLIAHFGLQKATVWRNYSDLQATIQRARSYRLVVGQRLHAIILAAGTAVPVVALAHCTKVIDFMHSFELQKYCVLADQLDPNAVLSLVEEADQGYSAYRAKLIQMGKHYRELQATAAEEVTQLIRFSAR